MHIESLNEYMQTCNFERLAYLPVASLATIGRKMAGSFFPSVFLEILEF
jgi:hypothetical protein